MPDGQTLLGYAVEGSHPEIVNWLLDERHYDVTRGVVTARHVTVQAGAYALSMAAKLGDFALVTRLLKLGALPAPPDAASTRVLSPVAEAAVARHWDVVQALLAAGASPRATAYVRDEGRVFSVVECAILQHDLAMLRLLIEQYKVPPRSPDFFPFGDTLLIGAVRDGWAEGAVYLMKQGADAYELNNRRQSAFDLAADDVMRDVLLQGSLAQMDDGTPAVRAGIALFGAIAREDHDGFAKALAVPGAMSFRNHVGNTALIFALGKKRVDLTLELIRAGAEFNYINKFGGTPLAYACSFSLEPAVEALLAAGADMERAENDALTPLEYAARQGSENLVRLLLAKGASVDSQRSPQRSIRRTPLMYAAGNGFKPIVRLLLAAKADPNARSEDGLSVFMWAVNSDDPEILQLLLEAGADKDYTLPTADGQNAASHAMRRNKLKALRLLTALGVRNEIVATRVLTDGRFYTAPEAKALMQFLADTYQPESKESEFWDTRHSVAEVAAFLEHGGNANFAGSATPLQLALSRRQFDVARYLIEHGAYASLVGLGTPETPLQLCFPAVHDARTDPPFKELAVLLLAHGADINARGVDNAVTIMTPPLILAVSYRYPEMFAFLLQQGADPDVMSSVGLTVPEAIQRSEIYTPLEKTELRRAWEAAVEARRKARPVEKKPAVAL